MFGCLGTDNKWKPDEQSSLGLSAKESMENRGNSAQFEHDARLNRESVKRFQKSDRMVKRDCMTTLAKQFWTHWSFRISLKMQCYKEESCSNQAY